MNTRAEQKLKTRRDLLEAALKLSAEKGFSSLSLREVTSSAGITAAAFYTHFHDMEELGLAMLDEVGAIFRRLLREARKQAEPGPKTVLVLIETFLKFVNENGNLFRLLLGERQGATPAFRKAIHSEIDRFANEIAADLEQTHGGLGKPLKDPALAAEAIVAVVFTIGAEALELPKHKQIGLRDRIIEHVLTILRGSVAN